MTNFCIVAIFKNESEILKEWIKHYLNEGCSKFFLIDNGSTDNYLPIIKKYKDKIHLVVDVKKHAQIELYNKYFKYFLSKIKKYEWILICDLDEFIYSRKNFKTIRHFLLSVENKVSQIVINWKIFGSNGFNTKNKKEPKSVINSFTKRIDYSKNTGFQGVKEIIGDVKMNLCKSIVRSNRVLCLGIHTSKVKPDITIDSNYQIIKKKNLRYIPCNEKILASQNLHLNHYAIRSFDWFTRVKMTRGSAASQSSTNIKSKISYFYSFDKVSNDIYDLELKNKKNKIKKLKIKKKYEFYKNIYKSYKNPENHDCLKKN